MNAAHMVRRGGQASVVLLGLSLTFGAGGQAEFGPAGTARGASTPASAPADAPAAPGDGPDLASSARAMLASLTGVQASSVTPAATTNLLGKDGRFTVLLLGSDSRSKSLTGRTDAIIVVSLEPQSGKVAAFSVPRDTVSFPLPGGRHYRSKINALYPAYVHANRKTALANMKATFGKAFGIEIDYAVVIGFGGVVKLVNAIKPVTVKIAKTYTDRSFGWVDARGRRHIGWTITKGVHQLAGQQALILARSRHGDSDYGRSARQQLLVAAAVTRTRALGGATGAPIMPALIAISKKTTATDLPLARWADLYSLVSRADLGSAKKVVFGPRSYASRAGVAMISLKMSTCRTWIRKNFPPPRNGATWPSP
jgi:LCP family protein required for cell wall assembly